MMAFELSFSKLEGFVARRIRRADLKPVVIDGVLFFEIEVGFAWSDPEAAIADAKSQIDLLKLKRYAGPCQIPNCRPPPVSLI